MRRRVEDLKIHKGGGPDPVMDLRMIGTSRLENPCLGQKSLGRNGQL